MSRILVVDDERNIRRVLQALLEASGHEVDAAGDGDEARAMLRRSEAGYDVVLTDLRMPGCDGMQLLRWVRAAQPDTPTVILTAHGTVDIAVEAMREGAFDFITKPFEDAELSSIIQKALAQREANRERAYRPGSDSDNVGTDSLGAPSPNEEAILSQIIGNSPQIKELFTLLRKVAPSPTTILLLGESGTGKELFASAAHQLSDRAEGPFVAVNCTAIPEGLFESELFGHEKGAFTGAVISRPGRCELADGGTLFLDEIGELPLAMQVKLLRALQEREVQRVGGMRPIPIDIRLVAATNADLAKMVREGTFREDLYYRLNVVPIALPPLRKRPSDIPELLRFFIDRFSKRLNRSVSSIDPDAEIAMVRYPWPGNIRQLENVIERMILLSEGERLQLSDLPPEIHSSALKENAPDREAEADTLKDEPLPQGNLKDIVKLKAKQVERAIILEALEQEQWNVTHAAKRLGISRKGLQLKMKDYELRGRAGTERREER
ncbi:MAG: DNA-binding response regulator [Rickettsiales bacterium]|nr:DNA-binding response regulator [Rickettsiales bacterium]